MVYKNNLPQVVWLTGAQNYNQDSSLLTQTEEMQNYVSIMTALQTLVNGTRKSFDYKVNYPVPQPYDQVTITVNTVNKVVTSTVFIAIIPIIIFLIVLVNIYIRSKRSKTVVVE